MLPFVLPSSSFLSLRTVFHSFVCALPPSAPSALFRMFPLLLSLAPSPCVLVRDWVPTGHSSPSLSSQLFCFPFSFFTIYKPFFCASFFKFLSFLSTLTTHRGKKGTVHVSECFSFLLLKCKHSRVKYQTFCLRHLSRLASLSCLIFFSLQSPFSISPLKILQGS